MTAALIVAVWAIALLATAVTRDLRAIRRDFTNHTKGEHQ